MADLTDIIRAGRKVVLVHGASGETNLLAERLGKPPRFVTSVSGIESRYTDRETLEIFEMAYCGKGNKALVEAFQTRGVNAVGLSGLDGRIFEGKRKDTITILEGGKRKVLRGDYTGKVERVNLGLVTLLLDHGYLPVLCPPAASYEGEAVNVDGDTAAAMLAAALKADGLSHAVQRAGPAPRPRRLRLPDRPDPGQGHRGLHAAGAGPDEAEAHGGRHRAGRRRRASHPGRRQRRPARHLGARGTRDGDRARTEIAD